MRMYGLYQHNNDYGGPGAAKLRDVIAGRSATNPAQFQLPDDNVTDGEAREFNIAHGREHRRRPRQHHRVCRRARQQAGAAARPRLLGVLAR